MTRELLHSNSSIMSYSSLMKKDKATFSRDYPGIYEGLSICKIIFTFMLFVKFEQFYFFAVLMGIWRTTSIKPSENIYLMPYLPTIRVFQLRPQWGSLRPSDPSPVISASQHISLAPFDRVSDQWIPCYRT